MNHWIKPLIALSALGMALAGGAGSAAADNQSGVPVPPVPKFNKGNADAYGQAIATYMDQRDDGWKDFYTKAKMTLLDAGGGKVVREVVFMILEKPKGNKMIARFRSPADVRGVGALIHEHHGSTHDTWLYLPASRRTRRISGANRTASFQGSEFTYEDLSRIIVEDYKWKFLNDDKLNGEPVFKLEAIPTYKDTGYKRLEVYIHQKHWRIEKVVFFDKAGRRLKTLTQSKWKHMHGRFWRALANTMVNHQTRKTTRIESKLVLVNLSLYKRRDGSPRANFKEAQFTKRALETSR